MNDIIKPMSALEKKKWLSTFSAAQKKQRRVMSAKLNHLALWLGRLVIAHNDLEYHLSYQIVVELIEVVGEKETLKDTLHGIVPRAMRRAMDFGLVEVVVASLSFRQKMDFLSALLLHKFKHNQSHQDAIRELFSLILSADEFRNRMVHSFYSEDYDGKSQSKYTRSKAKVKGFKGLRVESEAADIKKIRNAIDVITCLNQIGFIAMKEAEFGLKFFNSLPVSKLKAGLLPAPAKK